MTLAETFILSFGPAIAKAILKIWFKDDYIAINTFSTLIDLIKQKTSNVMIQQRSKRQFEEIGQTVAENLLPFFQQEAKGLDNAGQNAVLLSVVQTLEETPLSTDILAEKDLAGSALLETCTKILI